MDFAFVALCCVTLIVKSAAQSDNNLRNMDNVAKHDKKSQDDKNIQFKSNAQDNPSSVSDVVSFHKRRIHTKRMVIRPLKEVGFCGYYQRMNTLTASGWPYRKDKFTASHPSLPFNTKVLVSNGRRGVLVKINDRTNTRGHVLDLSLAAAYALGIPIHSMIRCSVRVLQIGDNKLRGDPTARKPCELTWFGTCRKNEDCCSGHCKKRFFAFKGKCVPRKAA